MSSPPRQRISVIVPARNEAARIGTTVRGIRDQATPDLELEVLVVDDGSSDGTSTAARDAGAVVLSSPAGGGNPAAARNEGARAASPTGLSGERFLLYGAVPAPEIH